MHVKKHVTVSIVLIVTLILLIAGKINVEGNNDNVYYRRAENLKCIYYNEKDFINIKDFETKVNAGSIRGCILPHHLTAKDLIHEVFQNIVNNKYETVVLIGPDHESIDAGKTFTTLKNWQTPFGILKTDKKITSELLKNDFIEESDYKLTYEHSISGIIPFVKYYLGDAQVVSLAITKQIKQNDIEHMVQYICENVDIDKTIFISSVDFSHYLDLDSANRMDSITMEAIERRDINKIMTFSNDNLDSPPSIVMILKIMNSLGAENTCMLNHSNTELIVKKSMEETTSYLTYLFY